MWRAVNNVWRVNHVRIYAIAIGAGSSAALGSGIWLYKGPLSLDSHHPTAWQSESNNKNTGDDVSGRFFSSKGGQVSDDTSGRVQGPTGSSTQPPPPQTRGHSVFDSEGDLTAWQQVTASVAAVGDTFGGSDESSLRSTLTRLVVPGWLRSLPGFVAKLKDELSMAPWSLSHEIWEEAHDPEINPEIVWDAEVRISKDLCEQEQRFLRQRRKNTAKALAKYLSIPESEIHPDDVPTVAICGSGGGLRALVAGAASYLSAHETGLFDVVTYSAGVSGSCWLQTLYYSSVGNLSHEKIINHLKQRIGIHIADPTAAVALLNQAPTNKYLLSGYVEKFRGVPDADFGLVDIYGLLLAARLMVPKGELGVSDWDLKVSNQSHYIDDGHQPLPIYTAVRHEIPAAPEDLADKAKEARFHAKHHDWFQWFEWTPYEFFCEELEAGIPTWAMGRRFHGGKSLWRDNGFALPELRVPLMMGIWGSAFCATLSHYLKEVSPVLKSFGFARLDAMIADKEDEFVKVHPIDPAVIPNFLLGLKERLPSSCPEDVHEATHLELMDAGMSNNLPIYPLLRPGRDVDVIIAFDASADVKGDNWVKVVDGYARQRNIKGWPMGAGWPTPESSPEEVAQDMKEAEDAAAAASSSQVGALERPDGRTKINAQELGHCTVWVGSTEERVEYMEEPASRRLDADDADVSHLAHPEAGIALVYFPFTANDKVDGVDPLKSDFMSTWNFVCTPEQIGQVVELARANFKEGEAQTKRTIEAVWRRKRDARLQREQEQLDHQRMLRLRRGRAAMFRNGDVGQGDQFSGI